MDIRIGKESEGGPPQGKRRSIAAALSLKTIDYFRDRSDACRYSRSCDSAFSVTVGCSGTISFRKIGLGMLTYA